MKIFRIAVLIFILFIGCLLFGRSQPKRLTVDVTKLNYNVINATLTLLKEHGKNQKPNDRKYAKQYTCTVVVSDDELEKESNSWIRNAKFPNSFTDNERRIKTQYNSINNTVHGEKIILDMYLDNLITEMQSDNRNKSYNEYPIVIMYSYYIPCTLKDHRCAALLAKDKQKRVGDASEYSMVIGFTQSFGMASTQAEKNLKGAFRSLQEANIVAYQLIRESKRGRSVYFVVTEESINNVGISRKIFENILYDCLRVHFVSNCCAVGKNFDQRVIFAIISTFVNNIVSTCNNDSLGRINDANRDSLKNCFDNYLNKNVKQDCIVCPNGETGISENEAKLLYGQCLQQSLYLAETFKVSPESTHLGSNKMAICNKRILSPSSGCTKQNIKRAKKIFKPVKRNRNQDP